MGPPGGGRMVISPRLQSRFNLINMTFPAQPQIKRIFGSMINQKLQVRYKIFPFFLPLPRFPVLFKSVADFINDSRLNGLGVNGVCGGSAADVSVLRCFIVICLGARMYLRFAVGLCFIRRFGRLLDARKKRRSTTGFTFPKNPTSGLCHTRCTVIPNCGRIPTVSTPTVSAPKTLKVAIPTAIYHLPPALAPASEPRWRCWKSSWPSCKWCGDSSSPWFRNTQLTRWRK